MAEQTHDTPASGVAREAPDQRPLLGAAARRDPRLGLRPEDVHRVNRGRVFSTIVEFGPISRRELSAQLGLAATMINELVSELVELDLVAESGAGPSGGGRPPILLAARSEHSYALAFAVTAGRIEVIATDPGGAILRQATRMHGPALAARAALDMMIDAGREVVDGVTRRALLAIGVALSAPVDSEGRMHPSDIGDWTEEGIDLPQELEDAFGAPVTIDNDANLGALAELRYGIGQGRRNLVYVLLHEGVGAGVIVDRRLYGGAANLSGELGHTVVERGGERCSCGNFGCLETVVSSSALLRYWREAVQVGRPTRLAVDRGDPSTEEIVRAANEGDGAAVGAVQRMAESVGLLVTNVLMLFDPEVIVLGGSITAAGDLLLDPARAIAENRTAWLRNTPVPTEVSRFKTLGPCMGAAVNAVDATLLTMPRRSRSGDLAPVAEPAS